MAGTSTREKLWIAAVCVASAIAIASMIIMAAVYGVPTRRAHAQEIDTGEEIVIIEMDKTGVITTTVIQIVDDNRPTSTVRSPSTDPNEVFGTFAWKGCAYVAVLNLDYGDPADKKFASFSPTHVFSVIYVEEDSSEYPIAASADYLQKSSIGCILDDPERELHIEAANATACAVYNRCKRINFRLRDGQLTPID